MRIVDEAVQDGVGVNGVANDLMPGGQRSWEVTTVDRQPYRSSRISEQIVTGAGVEGFEAEVVKRMSRSARPMDFDEARMAAVASGERQVLAELMPSDDERTDRLSRQAFWPMAQSQPALADAGRADQGQIVVGVDPFALRRASGTGRGQSPRAAR